MLWTNEQVVQLLEDINKQIVNKISYTISMKGVNTPGMIIHKKIKELKNVKNLSGK